MGIFRRKKKEQLREETDITFTSPTHVCVMKDMPWYMITSYNGRAKTASYQIIEPYICIAGCEKRVDKVLQKESWENISPEERERCYAEVRKRFKKYLRPRAVVEDMINNIFLVKDPDYLEMIEKMRGLPHSGCGTSSRMPRQDDTPVIEVKNGTK